MTYLHYRQQPPAPLINTGIRPQLKLLDELYGARMAKQLRELDLRSVYSDIPDSRLRLEYIEPKSLREIEAHVVVLHLTYEALITHGAPVYDLLLLMEVGGIFNIESIVKATSIILAKKLDELEDSRALQDRWTSSVLKRYIDDLIRTIIIASAILRGEQINYYAHMQEAEEYSKFVEDLSKHGPVILGI